MNIYPDECLVMVATIMTGWYLFKSTLGLAKSSHACSTRKMARCDDSSL